MEVKFIHESDQFHTNELCNQIEVTITLFMETEDTAGYEIESIYDSTAKKELELGDFNPGEQHYIIKQCEETCDDKVMEVAQDAEIAKGDAMYDAHKEGL